MVRQIKNIPGFFFDANKGKYFPNHMKSLYEKERKDKRAQVQYGDTLHCQIQNKPQSQSQAQVQTQTQIQNLDRFMMISRFRSDFILKKLERCQVHEIIWSNNIQIFENDQKYLRYSWFFDTLTFEEVKLDNQTKNHEILNSFTIRRLENLNSRLPILKFGKFKFFFNIDNLSSDFIYVLCGDECPVLQIFQFSNSVQVNRFQINYRLRPDLENPLIITDLGIIYESGEYDENDYERNKAIYNSSFRFMVSKFPNILTEKDEILNTYKEVTCFQNFSIGLVVACTGGKILFQSQEFGSSAANGEIQLNKSAVKWMHYYEKMLLVFTFHGKFVLINLETGDQQVLFILSDLSLYLSAKDFKFEDFKIEATEKIIFLGYRKGTEIVAYNFLEMSRGPIKKFSFRKQVEQFKISSDCLNLYIRHSE